MWRIILEKLIEFTMVKFLLKIHIFPKSHFSLCKSESWLIVSFSGSTMFAVFSELQQHVTHTEQYQYLVNVASKSSVIIHHRYIWGQLLEVSDLFMWCHNLLILMIITIYTLFTDCKLFTLWIWENYLFDRKLVFLTMYVDLK